MAKRRLLLVAVVLPLLAGPALVAALVPALMPALVPAVARAGEDHPAPPWQATKGGALRLAVQPPVRRRDAAASLSPAASRGAVPEWQDIIFVTRAGAGARAVSIGGRASFDGRQRELRAVVALRLHF